VRREEPVRAEGSTELGRKEWRIEDVGARFRTAFALAPGWIEDAPKKLAEA